MSRPNLTLASELEAAFAWWRGAGVDCDFADDATAWLAESTLAAALASDTSVAKRIHALSPTETPRPVEPVQPTRLPEAPPSPPMAVRRDLLGESPSPDLAAFHRWWMEAPGLDTAGLNPRIAPRGGTSAALMVLVPQPEEHDRDRLLDGPQGRLLTNMLAAMGLDDNATYIASALPCHTPMADLAALAAGGLDAVLAHHIALAAPQRLLVLGTGLAPMFDPVSNQPLREINYASGKVPVMVSETLEAMLHMPRLKARFWRRWIEWSPLQ